MRSRSSLSVSPIRSAWQVPRVLCLAWSRLLGDCNRSMRLLVVNAAWLVEAALVSSARPTLVQRRSVWFYGVEKYGRDI